MFCLWNLLAVKIEMTDGTLFTTLFKLPTVLAGSHYITIHSPWWLVKGTAPRTVICLGPFDMSAWSTTSFSISDQMSIATWPGTSPRFQLSCRPGAWPCWLLLVLYFFLWLCKMCCLCPQTNYHSKRPKEKNSSKHRMLLYFERWGWHGQEEKSGSDSARLLDHGSTIWHLKNKTSNCLSEN
jgi:hypothetical protein